MRHDSEPPGGLGFESYLKMASSAEWGGVAQAR
eukprot:SAG11_NODE_1164_length_5623_cov_18.626358_6_plen_33_part_00